MGKYRQAASLFKYLWPFSGHQALVHQQILAHLRENTPEWHTRVYPVTQ